MAQHKRGRWVKSNNIQVSGAPRGEKGDSGAELIIFSPEKGYAAFPLVMELFPLLLLMMTRRMVIPSLTAKATIPGFHNWPRTSASRGTLQVSDTRLGLWKHLGSRSQQLAGSQPFRCEVAIDTDLTNRRKLIYQSSPSLFSLPTLSHTLLDSPLFPLPLSPSLPIPFPAPFSPSLPPFSSSFPRSSPPISPSLFSSLSPTLFPSLSPCLPPFPLLSHSPFPFYLLCSREPCLTKR